MFRRQLIASIPLALLLAACGGDDPALSSDGQGHDAHGGESEVAAGARVVEVRGSSLRFDPPRIEAAAGEDLALELRAEDMEHDFVIDELDVHVGASGGERATGGFNTGDRPGSYAYYCSVPGHRDAGMEGVLVVR